MQLSTKYILLAMGKKKKTTEECSMCNVFHIAAQVKTRNDYKK